VKDVSDDFNGLIVANRTFRVKFFDLSLDLSLDQCRDRVHDVLSLRFLTIF
jgi:hypothetical protein